MQCGFVVALNPADQLRLLFSLIQLKMAVAERLGKNNLDRDRMELIFVYDTIIEHGV